MSWTDSVAHPGDELSARLHLAWNRRLDAWWHHYNREFAGGTMRPPRIDLGHGQQQLGRWEREIRRLVISVGHIARDPWVDVLATLRHEMAHQFADEVLGAADEAPHGPAFQQACRRLRCDPEIPASAAADTPAERTLARLKKVMSLTSSPNRHEAEAAVKHARRLLLRHNIDVTALDERRDFGHRHLGPVKARHFAHELWLAQILHEFFFVETIWVESYRAVEDQVGTVLQICGTPPNVELAAYVYDYLVQLLSRLWQAYRRERRLRANRERMRFYAGVLAGFCAKLREQEQRIQTEQALVWQADSQLTEYYRYLHPHVRVRQGRGGTVSPAYHDGVAAGREVTIHRPVSAGDGGFGGYLTGA